MMEKQKGDSLNVPLSSCANVSSPPPGVRRLPRNGDPKFQRPSSAPCETCLSGPLRPPVHPRIKREDLAGDVIEARQEGDGAGGIGGRVEAAEDVLGADFLAALLW